MPPATPDQFVRIAEDQRPRLTLFVDGVAIEALAGDTLLTAMLVNGRRVRESEFGDGPRAGFCVMGACQDCWVTVGGSQRVRACTTPAVDGMRIVTRPAGRS